MAMSTAVSLSDNPRPVRDNDTGPVTSQQVVARDGGHKGGRPKSDTIDGPNSSVVGRSATMRDKERKIGHRRVDETGMVTYKKRPTSELMAAIQLGIGQSIGCLAAKPERDLLMQDFGVVESVVFPSEGSNLTPAHHLSDFRFKTYAPIAFRYFRDLFGIQPEDFMLSLCNEPLRELSNPGASGSIFYITNDDEFIIKTVQHKEAEFLQKLLPGYYMNLNQNPRTLLPKFYGLFCYQCGGKNIRFIVMNNLIPSQFKMHEKYDMKGSTYKRKASKAERIKTSPTLKDLDFMQNHADGIYLEKETYDALFKTLERDCLVLESFKIMDYSFLMSVHNLDTSAREKSIHSRGPGLAEDAGSPISTGAPSQISPTSEMMASGMSGGSGPPSGGGVSLQRGKSIRTKLAQYSTAIESITANIEPEELDNEDIPPGGIPAKNSKGESLLLFLGIIDILQYYRLKKKFEHTLKSIVIDGDTISVHRPNYFARRFINFIGQTVFKKIQTLYSFPASTTALKHSPSKKKSQSYKQKTSTSEDPNISQMDKRPVTERSDRNQRTISFSDEVNPRPDLLPENATPPPPFSEAIGNESHSFATTATNHGSTSKSVTKINISNTTTVYGGSGDGVRTETVTARQSLASEQSASSGYSLPIVHNSPTLSVSASTPTHTEYTEGTPSYTSSSPSCSSEVLDANPSSPAYSPQSLGRDKVLNSVPTSSTETSYHSALESQEENSAVDSGETTHL